MKRRRKKKKNEGEAKNRLSAAGGESNGEVIIVGKWKNFVFPFRGRGSFAVTHRCHRCHRRRYLRG